LQGTVVALQTPDGRKAGSYLLETVDTWETQEGTTQRISYRISLTQADEHIVLT
jgi:phage protein U